jgi:hypothetical protein
MLSYQVFGQKAKDFKGYETINYCEKLISEVEDVESYHTGFAKLYKWLTTVIQLRKNDIIRRKAHAKRDQEFRDAKLDE